MDQDPQNPLAMRGFPAARALPLCPDALFLQECRYLRGEFQGPACGRDGPYTPDVFLWCCILFFATFALSSFLKKFKTSHYFPTRVSRRWWPASISTLVSQNGFPGALSSICPALVKLGNVGLCRPSSPRAWMSRTHFHECKIIVAFPTCLMTCPRLNIFGV